MRRRDEVTLWLPGLEWSGAAAVAPEPADSAERRRALDPETSFIVQAPAGSGKTELLIQRFLVLLARVPQPEATVAITFTVKAAGEMRARVLDALRSASLKAEPSGSHERFTLELAREALAQDARYGWNLLNNPDRLRIHTIDALCMGITRQMPWMSRFGAMPNVTENAQEMYAEAAARAVQMLGNGDETGSAVACLLRHLENDAARTAELLARMLETRDHWLRVLGTGEDLGALRTELERALGRIVSGHLNRLRDSVPGQHTAELLELARYAASNVRESDATIARCIDLAALPGCGPECVEHWLGLRKLLLTNDGDWRKQSNKTTGFPPHNKRMKQRFDLLRAELAPSDEFRILLGKLTALPACAYEESQWKVLASLFRLLPFTVAHLRSVFAEKGTVDFVEIASAARHALTREGQPTDLALAMGARIDHLLIDEFQDTSVTQFELLQALTSGWEDGQGRTVFLVGDPMQSIYRFRQAEVALFLNARDQGIGALQPEPLSLSVNFRSARAVVEWVNRIFPAVFPEQADASNGAVPYTPSVAFREGGEAAAVIVHPFIGREDQAEADLVIDIVQRARRESSHQRTAILVRSRMHLASIAASLRERAIPYRAIEIQALAEKPVIQDLLALTRALLHLADRVAWLAVLRAPWCGLTLADLYRIAGADRERTVWNLVHDPACSLEADGAQRLAQVLPVLSYALEMRGRVPVAQLVERTWIALGGRQIACENELADARAFFDLLEHSGRAGDVDHLELLPARVEELFANPDSGADGAVELMTIHKAKGLEFDTVILPGLGKKPRVEDTPLLLWSERPEDGRTDLLMAPIAARRDGDDRTYTFIRRENDAKARHESERLLYVACTRAKSRLYLLGHVELRDEGGETRLCDPPRESLLAHIWDAVRPEFQRAFETAVAGTPAPQPERQPRTLSRVRLAGSLPATMPEPEPAHRAARIRTDGGEVPRKAGTVVHRLLERIARDGIAAWSPERIDAIGGAVSVALAGAGVPPNELDQARERVQAALRRTLDDAVGRWILSDHPGARSEFAISALIDGEVRHLVIDRTFAGQNGTRWIIDFKTSEPEGCDEEAFLEAERREYEAQLQRYAGALAELEQGSMRVGLYFPMIGRWLEWDPSISVRRAPATLQQNT